MSDKSRPMVVTSTSSKLTEGSTDSSSSRDVACKAREESKVAPTPVLQCLKEVQPVPLQGKVETTEGKSAIDDDKDLEGKKSLIKSEPSLRGLFLKGRRLGMSKEFPIVISGTFNVQASGGFINSTLNVDQVSAISRFTSMATLFDEFFVRSMKVSYVAMSRYSVLPGGTTGTQNTSLPLCVVSLHHGSSPYSTLSDAANNGYCRFCSTGDPWLYTWTNVEDPSAGVAPVSTTSSPPPTQGWCLVQNASVYTGYVQIISPQSVVTGLPGSVYVGTLKVDWDILFRCKV